MRRVLLVSYYAPPRAGVATTRTRQLIDYLPLHGWNVTVFTAALPGAQECVIQSGYVDLPEALKTAIGLRGKSAHGALGISPAPRGLRRSPRQWVVAWGYRLTSYPDPQVGWLLPGRRAFKAALAQERYDAVLSSSPPFTTDLMLASACPDIPWVADYRDLWGDSDYYASPMRQQLDRWLERWTLRRVSAVTTISHPMADALRSHRSGLPVEVIPNAFDETEWRDVPFEHEDRTTFVYAGQLFGGRRDPRPLFRAVRTLIERGELSPAQLHIDLYCVNEPWLSEAILQSNLTHVVRVRGVVPREDVMRAERRSDRLLVFLWDGTNTEGILTGKIFEYLGARRRVLAVGGPRESAVDQLLGDTGAGIRVRDEAAIGREILDAVAEHRRGAIQRTDETRLRAFSADEMARRFAAVLDRVTGLPSATQALEPASAVRHNP